MSIKSFEDEMRRLLSIQFKIKELNDDTSLKLMDSLGIMELTILAEEHLGVEITFHEAKNLHTYEDLKKFIIGNKIKQIAREGRIDT